MNWRVCLLGIFILNDHAFASKIELNKLEEKIKQTVRFQYLKEFFDQRPDLALNYQCRQKAELNFFGQPMETLHCPESEFLSYLESMKTANGPWKATYPETHLIEENYAKFHKDRPIVRNDFNKLINMTENLEEVSNGNTTLEKEIIARLFSYLVREEECSQFVSVSLGFPWHPEDRKFAGDTTSDTWKWFNSRFPQENPLNKTPSQWYDLYAEIQENCCQEYINTAVLRVTPWLNIEKCPTSYDYNMIICSLFPLVFRDEPKDLDELLRDLIGSSECLNVEKQYVLDFVEQLEMKKHSYYLPCFKLVFDKSIKYTRQQWIDSDCNKENYAELKKVIKFFFRKSNGKNLSPACFAVLKAHDTMTKEFLAGVFRRTMYQYVLEHNPLSDMDCVSPWVRMAVKGEEDVDLGKYCNHKSFGRLFKTPRNVFDHIKEDAKNFDWPSFESRLAEETTTGPGI